MGILVNQIIKKKILDVAFMDLYQEKHSSKTQTSVLN